MIEPRDNVGVTTRERAELIVRLKQARYPGWTFKIVGTAPPYTVRCIRPTNGSPQPAAVTAPAAPAPPAPAGGSVMAGSGPFSIDTDLKITKSPLTAEFIDDYLKDKRNGELSGIGKAVIEAANRLGINAAYIAAHAGHESAWGSSRICKDKNNLFGWGAVDADPYNSAKTFASKKECIDFVMERVNESYLTRGGKFFKKTACLGMLGPGGYGMNAKYATDPGWGRKIAKIALEMEEAFLKSAPAAARGELGTNGANLLTADALFSRARSAMGRKIKYQLGGGGDNPGASLPAVPAKGCDCSGFVCWCLGLARQTDHPLYVKFSQGAVYTDSMVNDALSETGYFTCIDKAEPGCIVIYPSKRPVRDYGHVGIVSEAKNGAAIKVIHCSRGNYDKTGDAIAETGPEAFQNGDAIYARYEGLT